MATKITPEQRRAYVLHKRLSLAYWPKPELNESANRVKGDAAVDRLSIEQLALFFRYIDAGPTYCMVKQRVLSYQALLSLCLSLELQTGTTMRYVPQD